MADTFTEDTKTSPDTGTDTQSGKTQNRKEEYKVKGDDLLKQVKQIVKEGNVRRLIIKNREGKVLIELPVTVGVIGVVIAPALAAVGAIAALVTECSITVIRTEDTSTPVDEA